MAGTAVRGDAVDGVEPCGVCECPARGDAVESWGVYDCDDDGRVFLARDGPGEEVEAGAGIDEGGAVADVDVSVGVEVSFLPWPLACACETRRGATTGVRERAAAAVAAG